MLSRPTVAKERSMPIYDELVRLARMCLQQAGETMNPIVSAELRCRAKEYQRRAADLDEGKPPNIGEDRFGIGQLDWTGSYPWRRPITGSRPSRNS
jgi:hypothetical protein